MAAKSVQAVSSGQKRKRKEIRMLTGRELDVYFRAVRAAKANTDDDDDDKEKYLKKTGLIFRGSLETFFPSRQRLQTFTRHWQSFIPELHPSQLTDDATSSAVTEYENMLRDQGPEYAEVTIPYWDSRLEARMEQPTNTVLFTDRFLGTGSGEATGGILGNGWPTSAGPLVRNIGTDGPPMTDEAIVNVTRMTKMSKI
ncbi:hypothetical protein CHS0354_030259 [Potamilus streckersoni]|uniref:Uncharacterized protein n=1 Tax=Potamilus streckersoni TaxID=2493646 RepID=A0AAE0SYH1_9BIVA|nr:hypothetical protein CHS0354_030259 [Potamilus streckersoni]